MASIGSHGIGRAVKAVIRPAIAGDLATINRAHLPRHQPLPQRWTCSDCRASIRRSDALRRLEQRPFTTSRRTRDDSQPALPSKVAESRTQLSTRLTHLTDSILARASIAGQHINVYTGTDYSGISALRDKITEQEQLVRAKAALVEQSRVTHSEAHTTQAAAQKEIVGLLERKSSWSPTDLERYMSLVRSEHTNEQAVQAASDGLAASERDLEDSRRLLERLERKQYHEEQIWSDTIRRNSTWVTFGLMGVNIVLLLAQIAVFEPYRRKKIVREVERVVEEKAMVVGRSYLAREGVEVANKPEVVEEPVVVLMEPAGEHAPVGDSKTQIYSPPIPQTEIPLSATGDTGSPLTHVQARTRPETWTALYESYVESFQDLFSERMIQLKKVDLTTTALQGAATGVAAMGLLFVLFRPR